jgi:hypothetical protein
MALLFLTANMIKMLQVDIEMLTITLSSINFAIASKIFITRNLIQNM